MVAGTSLQSVFSAQKVADFLASKTVFISQKLDSEVYSIFIVEPVNKQIVIHVCLNSSRKLPFLPLVFLHKELNNSVLHLSVRSLGVILHQSLILLQHTSHACRTVYFRCQRISTIRYYLPTDAMKAIICGLCYRWFTIVIIFWLAFPNILTDFKWPRIILLASSSDYLYGNMPPITHSSLAASC